jgi:hypothetical protein
MKHRGKTRRDEAYQAAYRARFEAEAEAVRDPLTLALDAYRAAFGELPTIMGLESARYPGLIVVLREAVAEGQPLSDPELRRRLGMTMPPPGAEI